MSTSSNASFWLIVIITIHVLLLNFPNGMSAGMGIEPIWYTGYEPAVWPLERTSRNDNGRQHVFHMPSAIDKRGRNEKWKRKEVGSL